jgi:hypothetical protein
MLQVTFRNLLPSEELVGAANDVYLKLRERTAGGGGDARCYVTISAEPAAEHRPVWVRVQVELVPGEGKTLRVLTEGADAALAVRSGILAAGPARLDVRPARRQTSELVLGAC